MSKRKKIVIFILSVIGMIFAVGIVRFYTDVSQETGGNDNSGEIESFVSSDDDGNRIFEGKNGLYGVTDPSGRITAAPEWGNLLFAGDGRCIASKGTLTGVVDYEGNITVPFIYGDIHAEYCGATLFYVARTSPEPGRYVIYDETFAPCFMRDWDGCRFTSDGAVLESGGNVFTYILEDGSFQCDSALIKGEAAEKEYSFSLHSRVLLSELDSRMLETLSSAFSAYLEYAYTGDAAELAQYTGGGSTAGFSVLFGDDPAIVSRELMGISDIYLYSERRASASDTRSYMISATPDTVIKYTDSAGNRQILRDRYKIRMRFTSDGSQITPVSAGCVQSGPDYPPGKVAAESAEPETQEINR